MVRHEIEKVEIYYKMTEWVYLREYYLFFSVDKGGRTQKRKKVKKDKVKKRAHLNGYTIRKK